VIRRKEDRLAYFVMDEELLFHLVTHCRDFECSLPEDAKIEWIEMEPPSPSGPVVGGPGRVRFVFSSVELDELPEASQVPKMTPSWTRPSIE
jgi:hypothetical protein